MADLHPGDLVRPAGYKSDRSVWGSTGEDYGQRADEHAFAAETESTAWRFAEAAGDRSYSGRATVLRVTPAGPSHVGVYHPRHPEHTADMERMHEHVSKVGYHVVERIDTRPGYQGTIPIDWHPFARPGTWADVNHPEPEEVAYGHLGSQFRARHDLAAQEAKTQHRLQTLGIANRDQPAPGQLGLFDAPAPTFNQHYQRELDAVPAQPKPKPKRRSLNTLGARQ